jgi:Flp pilus assembly protein TadD
LKKTNLRYQYAELVICLALMIAVLSVYWPVQHHDFINVDDDLYITENPTVRDGITKAGFIWAFSFNDVDYWHPLTWLSHMVDCQLYGLNPQGHHFNSLLLHAVNSILLFLVLIHMTGALWRSAAVAAMFALHPLNVESVAWIAERKNLLSAFFWILTIWTYAHYSEKPGPMRFLLVFLCLGLGLMAKPILATLPFVLLLLDYWPLARLQLRRSNEQPANLRFHQAPASRLVLEKIPLFVLVGTLTYLSFLSSHARGLVISTETLPMGLRIQNALISYVTYIFKMVWPSNLAVFYPFPKGIPFWHYAGASTLIAAMSVLVIRVARRAPYLATGWLWYLGTLVPVIGLFQHGLWPASADRFTYIPLIGLFIIISWGLASIGAKWKLGEIIFPLLVGIVLLAFGIGTWTQARHWKNSMTLFQHAVDVTANNHLAEFNLATALHEQGNLQDAVTHYSKALRIMPDNEKFHNSLGVAMLELGDIDGAIKHLSEALRLVPNYADAYVNLGTALAKAGKPAQAISYYRRALEIKPLAKAHYNLGLALAEMRKFDEAISHYQQALRIKPDYASVHNDLGVALSLQGKIREAMFHFSEAIRIKPDYKGAQHNLRLISSKLNDLRGDLPPAPGGVGDQQKKGKP